MNGISLSYTYIVWRGCRAFFAHVLPFAALVLGAVLALAPPAPAMAAGPANKAAGSARPARIASVDLCADVLVLKLARRERIVTVSHLASDHAISTVLEEARGLPSNDGQVEELVRHKPDIVVALNTYPAARVGLLRSFGVRTVLIKSPSSIADVRETILQVADAVGEPERGRRMVGEIERRLAAVARTRRGPHPLAVVYGPAGSTSGTGTLVNEILNLAGWRNLAAEKGIRMWGNIPLEPVLARRPDAIIVDYQDYGGLSLAEALLDHPAITKMGGLGRVIRVPSGFWLCSSPEVADAVEMLALEARRIQELGQELGREQGS